MPTAGGGKHILVYPFPSSGHIIPLLDLTHRLLTRGLKVTIVITPANSPLLDPLLSSHPSLQTLVLPSPAWSTKPPAANRLISIMRGLRELHYPELLDWFRSQPSPPVAILSDFFLGWTQQFASDVGVPRVVFSPSGVLSMSVSFSLWSDLPKIEEGADNVNFQVSFPKIPNCPTYPWFQISHIYRTYNEGHPDWELYRSCMMANRGSWGVVFNSFAELEGNYVDHIKKEMGHDRVWAVGPVLPPDDDLAGSTSRGGTSSVPSHEVLMWLDSRPDNSVVYVCFGSRQVLIPKQMDTLAAALEKSGVHFIWCVRERNDRNMGDDCGFLPDGFEARVADRGYIINGWAQQVAILRHRATGAFLTHCGWNSTLEGIAAGVVMLTWPMMADQFTDAQLLVDELGVGIRVGEGTEKIPESSELAQLLAESVNGTRPERIKAKETSVAAMSAVTKGGSSDRDLDDFIKNINELKI